MQEPSTAQPGQVVIDTPPPAQQATVQNPPANQPVIINSPEPPPPNPAPAPPAAPTPSPEQFAQLQQQLQQRERDYQQQQDQYRHLQGEFTRRSQALAQLTGANPAAPVADPLAPYVQQLVADGIHKDDAARIAKTQYAMIQSAVAPLQQQLQQAQATVQASTQIDPIMQQLYAQRPDLLQNPEVYHATREAMIAQASRGGVIDLMQAGATAASLSYMASIQQPPPQGQPVQWQPNVVPMPQQQQQPMAQPYARGMYGVQPNFQQQPQPGPAPLPPDAQFVADEMRARFNLQPKTA